MLYRSLGKSSLQVSEVSLGCMSLDGMDALDNKRCIQAAYEAGINYFDTADFYGYGANERLVGEAISSFRDKIVLATKVGNRWDDNTFEKTWDVSKEYILHAIDASLKRLNTEYIDLYQIHGGTIDDNFEEVVETLEGVVQSGKIRYYGISSIRPNVFSYYAKQTNIVSNMIQYSLLDTRPEEYLEEFSEQQISVIARGSLAQGILVDKEARPYLEHKVEEVSTIQHILQGLTQDYGLSKEALALHYVLQQKAVASALVGVRTTEQLQALLIARKELAQIPTDIWSKVDIPSLKYKEHR